MPTLTIEEAQARLSQIIDDLQMGDELIITRGDQEVSRLVPPALPKGVPIYGRGKGKLILNMDDDSHLEDFAEYVS